MSNVAARDPGETAVLRRSLGLWNLVFCGIILIQPTAPMPLFGVVSQEARGHVATTVLIGLVAMMLTALSYGRMAREHPSAGSSYTYVGRELHPALGLLTGWSIALDYLVNPIICVVWCSKSAALILPQIPYTAWAVIFALLFTALNLRGIQSTARTNEALVFLMGGVIVWFCFSTARFVMALPARAGNFWTQPFYDPATFVWPALWQGTSIAVLTYIGFDGISTLSEEVKDPRRNVLRATVLTCFLIGLLSLIEVYAGQLVWPDFKSFPDADTAFVHIAGRAGGALLMQAVNLTLLVATIGSGSGAQLAGARLLFGMGRDEALPKRFFGAVDTRTGVPRNNVLLTGAIALAGAFLISYQLGAELLNFGAFIAFMGVNASAFRRALRAPETRTISGLVPPVLGFLVCGYLFFSLRTPAKIAGCIWLASGAAYALWRTRGFRVPLRLSDGPPAV